MAAEAKLDQRTHAGVVITVIGSLSVVLIAIVTQARAYLNFFVFNIIVGGCGIAILGLVAYYFIGRPIWPKIVRWRINNRRESIATRLFPELANLVDKFTEIAASNNLVTINQAIRSFQITQPNVDNQKAIVAQDRMGILMNAYHLVIDQPLGELKAGIDQTVNLRPSFPLFRHFFSELWYLVWAYKLVFVNQYVQTCRWVGEDAVRRDSRDEYSKFVSKYNQFATEFCDLGKKANQSVGELMFPDHIEDAIALRL
jgi:hypothetical protein